MAAVLRYQLLLCFWAVVLSQNLGVDLSGSTLTVATPSGVEITPSNFSQYPSPAHSGQALRAALSAVIHTTEASVILVVPKHIEKEGHGALVAAAQEAGLSVSRIVSPAAAIAAHVACGHRNTETEQAQATLFAVLDLAATYAEVSVFSATRTELFSIATAATAAASLDLLDLLFARYLVARCQSATTRLTLTPQALLPHARAVRESLAKASFNLTVPGICSVPITAALYADLVRPLLHEVAQAFHEAVRGAGLKPLNISRVIVHGNLSLPTALATSLGIPWERLEGAGTAAAEGAQALHYQSTPFPIRVDPTLLCVPPVLSCPEFPGCPEVPGCPQCPQCPGCPHCNCPPQQPALCEPCRPRDRAAAYLWLNAGIGLVLLLVLSVQTCRLKAAQKALEGFGQDLVGRLDLVDNKVTQADKKLDKVDVDLTRADKKLDEMHSKVDHVKFSVTEVGDGMYKALEAQLGQVKADFKARIDEGQANVTQLKADVASVDTALGTAHRDIAEKLGLVDTKVTQAQVAVGQVKDSLAQVHVGVGKVDNTATQIGTKLDTVHTQLCGQLETAERKVDGRLVSLAYVVASTQVAVSQVSDDTAQVATQIGNVQSALGGRLDTVQRNVAEVVQQVASVDKKLDGVHFKVDAVQTHITKVSGHVDRVGTDVNTKLQENLTEINKHITAKLGQVENMVSNGLEVVERNAEQLNSKLEQVQTAQQQVKSELNDKLGQVGKQVTEASDKLALSGQDATKQLQSKLELVEGCLAKGLNTMGADLKKAEDRLGKANTSLDVLNTNVARVEDKVSSTQKASEHLDLLRVDVTGLMQAVAQANDSLVLKESQLSKRIGGLTSGQRALLRRVRRILGCVEKRSPTLVETTKRELGELIGAVTEQVRQLDQSVQSRLGAVNDALCTQLGDTPDCVPKLDRLHTSLSKKLELLDRNTETLSHLEKQLVQLSENSKNTLMEGRAHAQQPTYDRILVVLQKVEKYLAMLGPQPSTPAEPTLHDSSSHDSEGSESEAPVTELTSEEEVDEEAKKKWREEQQQRISRSPNKAVHF